jgi:hypothetical protein
MVNASSPWLGRIIISAISLAVIGGLLWFLLRSEHSPLFFVIYMRHLEKQQERFLCYEIDHAIVADTLRTFAEQQKWAEVGFDKDDPRVPATLRVLKPSAIFVHPDYIALDFGGSFFQMDIRAFKPGNSGSGTKKLAEGLWLYTEDGSYPREE